jgi:hypothetical protein
VSGESADTATRAGTRSSSSELEPQVVSSSTEALSGIFAEVDRLGFARSATPAPELDREPADERTSTSALGLTAPAPTAGETEIEPEAGDGARASMRVPLVYTGASYGIARERYEFGLPSRIERALGGGGKILRATSFHGVLVQGSSVLLAPDHRAQSAIDFLSGGPIACGAPRPALSIRTDTERMLLEGDLATLAPTARPHWFATLGKSATVRALLVRSCTNPRGAKASWYSPALDDRPLSFRLEDFEFRRGLFLEFRAPEGAVAAPILGIPSDDPGRRFRRLELARRPVERTLYADAGSFVDGASRFDNGALSIHRPLAYEMLSRLEPSALVPGRTELLPGAEQFVAEARAAGLSYLATNWRSSARHLELERFRLSELSGGARVVFLGVVDPEIAAWAPKLRAEGVELTDPVKAVDEVLTALEAAGKLPAVVVLLTTVSPKLLLELRRRLRGVDLLVGDTSLGSERLTETALDVVPRIDRDRRVAAVLPLSGIQRAELSLSKAGAGWALSRLMLRPEDTSEYLRPDARTVAILTRARAKSVGRLERPLVAPKAGGPLETFSEAEWRRMVCEAIRSTTGADVVLLPELPAVERTPGPLTELIVAERLAVADRLEVDRIRGQDLSDLLRDDDPASPVKTACGGETGSSPNVLGRSLVPDLYYRVVTTDRAALLGLGERFVRAHSGRILSGSGLGFITEDGQPLTLRAAALRALRRMREGHSDGAPPEPLLADSASTKLPAWFATLELLSLGIERFHGAGDAAFSNVPETLATTASSLGVSFAADAALSYDSERLLGELRLHARYHRLDLPGGVVQKPDDDLQISSSGSLPGIPLHLGPTAWMPFGQLVFDTEFARDVDPNGAPLPRRADLSANLGLAMQDGFFDRLRLTAVALRDLSRIERATRYGGRIEAKLEDPLGHGIRLISTLDATAFARAAGEDATNLRMKALVESRLALPLAALIDVAAYGKLFAFIGAVPETNHLAASYELGLALELRGALRL